MTSTISQTPDALLPCNIEMEEAILGGILLDPNALPRVIDCLEPEHFFIIAHQKIYRAVLSLERRREKVDLMTVTGALQAKGQLESVGGTGKLAQLLDRTVCAVNIDRYAAILREKFARRQLIDFSYSIQRTSYDERLPFESIAEKVKTQISQLLTPFISDPLQRQRQEYKKLLQQIEAIELDLDIDLGLKEFRFQELSKKTGKSLEQLSRLYYKSLISNENETAKSLSQLVAEYGSDTQSWLINGLFPRGNTTLLHALGGAGKTRLSYDFAYHLALGLDWNGFPTTGRAKTLIVQTDEQPVDIITNMTARGFGDEHPVLIKTKWAIEYIPQLVKEVELHRPDFVIIDSLSSISRFSTVSENDAEFARPILLLNKIARDFNCHILLLHHSNKMGDSRGTTATYNAVSQVFQLTRDSKQDAPDAPQRILAIDKSRSRRPAKYQIEYQPEDRSWFVVGEEGAMESPDCRLRDEIVKFLAQQRGTKFENAEIAHALNDCSSESVRRATRRLAEDGLINRERRFSERRTPFNLYFLELSHSDLPHQVDRHRPVEPTVTSLLRESQLSHSDPQLAHSDPPHPNVDRLKNNGTVTLSPLADPGSAKIPPQGSAASEGLLSDPDRLNATTRMVETEVKRSTLADPQPIHPEKEDRHGPVDSTVTSPLRESQLIHGESQLSHSDPKLAHSESQLAHSAPPHQVERHGPVEPTVTYPAMALEDENTRATREDYLEFLQDANDVLERLGWDSSRILSEVRSRYGADNPHHLWTEDLIDWFVFLLDCEPQERTSPHPVPGAPIVTDTPAQTPIAPALTPGECAVEVGSPHQKPPPTRPPGDWKVGDRLFFPHSEFSESDDPFSGQLLEKKGAYWIAQQLLPETLFPQQLHLSPERIAKALKLEGEITVKNPKGQTLVLGERVRYTGSEPLIAEQFALTSKLMPMPAIFCGALEGLCTVSSRAWEEPIHVRAGDLEVIS